MDASELLQQVRLVPVVTIEQESVAIPLARALVSAGIPAIEVTLRTPAAMDAIAAIAGNDFDIIVGAGSIREPGQVETAVRAGARFGVCPGSSPAILEAVRQHELPFVPGGETASEMIALLERGYRLQKFFPAELLGGLARIKALSAPLPEIRFFPTGGIDSALARDYLAFDKVHCVGGSWFIPSEPLEAGHFDRIEALAREAIEAIHGN